jgi:glycerophosphoryl diester phosphodiesterase
VAVFGTRRAGEGAAPVVVGHRGAPRLATENTPASFTAAVAAGATWVELDARRSADGEAVVHHDPETADGVALIERTAANLEDHGVWTLTDILAGLAPGVGVDIELKNLPGDPDYDDTHALARTVAAALCAHGDRPLLASSFNPLTIAAVRAAAPDVVVGLIHGDTLACGVAIEVALEYGAVVLCPHVDAPGAGEEGIAAAHAAGLEVMVWTVNDPADAQALAAAGADALCTDEPGLIAAALTRRP